VSQFWAVILIASLINEIWLTYGRYFMEAIYAHTLYNDPFDDLVIKGDKI